MKLIVFSGKIGSGKDYLADKLYSEFNKFKDKYDFVRISFGEYLKKEVNRDNLNDYEYRLKIREHADKNDNYLRYIQLVKEKINSLIYKKQKIENWINIQMRQNYIDFFENFNIDYNNLLNKEKELIVLITDCRTYEHFKMLSELHCCKLFVYIEAIERTMNKMLKEVYSSLNLNINIFDDIEEIFNEEYNNEIKKRLYVLQNHFTEDILNNIKKLGIEDYVIYDNSKDNKEKDFFIFLKNKYNDMLNEKLILTTKKNHLEY